MLSKESLSNKTHWKERNARSIGTSMAISERIVKIKKSPMTL